MSDSDFGHGNFSGSDHPSGPDCRHGFHRQIDCCYSLQRPFSPSDILCTRRRIFGYDGLWTDLANGMSWLSNTLKRGLQKCYEMKFRRCEELWMQLPQLPNLSGLAQPLLKLFFMHPAIEGFPIKIWLCIILQILPLFLTSLLLLVWFAWKDTFIVPNSYSQFSWENSQWL